MRRNGRILAPDPRAILDMVGPTGRVDVILQEEVVDIMPAAPLPSPLTFYLGKLTVTAHDANGLTLAYRLSGTVPGGDLMTIEAADLSAPPEFSVVELGSTGSPAA